jgi:hypothetical protein
MIYDLLVLLVYYPWILICAGPLAWLGCVAPMDSAVVPRGDGRQQIKFSPPHTANTGVRYTRKLFNRECSVRLDVNKITNASGQTISAIYVALPQLRRNHLGDGRENRLRRADPDQSFQGVDRRNQLA